MTDFTDVFGGANVYPSDISYSAVTITADIALDWPRETSSSANLATRIMDVIASSEGLNIILPNATMATEGETILFNNKGLNSFNVLSKTLAMITDVRPAGLIQVYLADNSTSNGLWRAVLYGVYSPIVIDGGVF